MPVWESEIEVDEDLARTLVAERFPDLELTGLRRLGAGWDNTVWAIGEEIVFRFPRREIAIAGVQREMAILPVLAGRLPAAIPDACYLGAASAEFPWPWFGSRLIAGRELAFADVPAGRRGRLAGELGEFLGALHRLEPSITPALVIDPMRRGEMRARVPRTRAALEQVAPLWEGGQRAGAVLDAAERLGPDSEAVIVHGDLNVRHPLVSPSGGLAGVIDWGDTCLAPRSVDLALYWSLFDAEGRAAFRAAYGPLSDQTLTRARVLALFFDATLAVYANQTGMAELQAEALHGLTRTLID